MASTTAHRLILASGSPARRELLERAGYTFTIMPAGIDEPTGAGFSDARTYVQHVAWLKAAAVAQRLGESSWPGDAIIVAADTVGWLHGEVVGKPEDRQDARRILRLLAGSEHELWTGVCLWRADELQVAWQEMSRVRMRAMADEELETYLDSRQWEGCSGAYAIQEEDDPYIQAIEGSVSNIIGLPMETLGRVLERFGK